MQINDNREYNAMIKQVAYDLNIRYNYGKYYGQFNADNIRKYLNVLLLKINENVGEELNSKIDSILQYELSNTILYNGLTFPTSGNIGFWWKNAESINSDCIINNLFNDNNIILKAGLRMKDEYRAIFDSKNYNNFIVTSGYNLPTKRVFHLILKKIAPSYYLSKTILEILSICNRNSYKTLVIPEFREEKINNSNLNKMKIIYTIISSLSEFKKNNNLVTNIIFCCEKKETFDMYKKCLSNISS